MNSNLLKLVSTMYAMRSVVYINRNMCILADDKTLNEN